METVKIAGVSIRKDKIKEVNYDQMMKLALNSPKYNSIRNAKKLIEAEFKEHGIVKKEDDNDLLDIDKPKSKPGKSGGDSRKDNSTKKG